MLDTVSQQTMGKAPCPWCPFLLACCRWLGTELPPGTTQAASQFASSFFSLRSESGHPLGGVRTLRMAGLTPALPGVNLQEAQPHSLLNQNSLSAPLSPGLGPALSLSSWAFTVLRSQPQD